MTLELQSGDAAISSKFQVAKISKPLWSVAKICDAGYKVVFDAGKGTIYHKQSGNQVGVFERKGGLYVSDMKLRNPSYVAKDGKQESMSKSAQGFRRQD